MAWETIVLLLLAGMVCGGINAIAGGATLLGFPVLLSIGLPPNVANASNFIATMPGYAASIPAYTTELRGLRKPAFVNVMFSTAGAGIGSILLVLGGEAVFTGLIPYLLLTATLLYGFSDRIHRYFMRPELWLNMNNIWFSNSILFSTCIYGGYFGAGLGIIMLSILRIIGYADFHQANGLKNVIITAVSLFSIAIFMGSSLIAWPEAITMMIGATIGGYKCAQFAKRIPPEYLHKFVLVFGTVATVYYFSKDFSWTLPFIS